MEDKNLYNKIMLIAFCLIVVLLCAGMYSWFHEKRTMPDMETPHEKTQVLEWEPDESFYGLKGERTEIWNF